MSSYSSGNSNSVSFEEIGKKRASKRGAYGTGMVNKYAGTPSPQCKAGMHHQCIKQKCGCTKCTHGGIR